MKFFLSVFIRYWGDYRTNGSKILKTNLIKLFSNESDLYGKYKTARSILGRG